VGLIWFDTMLDPAAELSLETQPGGSPDLPKPLESISCKLDKLVRTELIDFEADNELDFSHLDSELIVSHMLADPSLTQFCQRHVNGEGETLVGYFRCGFATHQQRFVLHVPFYPHFAEIPEVSATLFDDIRGRVRITDSQKFGARLEMVLDHPAVGAQQVWVEVTATLSIPSGPS
jgi:hypothetical protein